MQTRKKTRRNINLPGRYFTGTGQPVDVVLRDVSEGGCRFPLGSLDLATGSPIQIFIGALGPYRGTVRWIGNGEVGVNFTTPLSAEVVARFQSSHIPDPSGEQPTGTFAPMSPGEGGPPRRFC